MSTLTLATFAFLLLQCAKAAPLTSRLVPASLLIVRPRRSRIAGGIIAAIVIPSLVGLGLLLLCCVCTARLFRSRRRTSETNPDVYATPGLPMDTGGMYPVPGVGYSHGGATAYGPPPGAPPQAYHPGGKDARFVGGFADRLPHY